MSALHRNSDQGGAPTDGLRVNHANSPKCDFGHIPIRAPCRRYLQAALACSFSVIDGPINPCLPPSGVLNGQTRLLLSVQFALTISESLIP
jgi:hypothetical protein